MRDAEVVLNNHLVLGCAETRRCAFVVEQIRTLAHPSLCSFRGSAIEPKNGRRMAGGVSENRLIPSRQLRLAVATSTWRFDDQSVTRFHTSLEAAGQRLFRAFGSAERVLA